MQLKTLPNEKSLIKKSLCIQLDQKCICVWPELHAHEHTQWNAIVVNCVWSLDSSPDYGQLRIILFIKANMAGWYASQLIPPAPQTAIQKSNCFWQWCLYAMATTPPGNIQKQIFSLDLKSSVWLQYCGSFNARMCACPRVLFSKPNTSGFKVKHKMWLLRV